MIGNEIIAVIVSAVVAYLLGSLPFAVFVAKFAGVDIFKVGTGNPGASNVFRKVGRKYGAVVFGLDIAKGAVAVIVAMLIGCPDLFLPVASVFAIVGHWLPVFMRFQGWRRIGDWCGYRRGIAWGLGIGRSGGRSRCFADHQGWPQSSGCHSGGSSGGSVSDRSELDRYWRYGVGASDASWRVLFLVEFPKDRRAERPEPHIRN